MAVIIIAANINLIMLAGDNPPNLVAENYYERGQDYEKNMLKRLARDPGWEMSLQPPEALTLNQPSSFQFTVVGDDGQEALPDSVVLHMYRPSDAKADFSVPMTLLGAGTYTAEVTFPLKGAWDVLASATQDDHEFSVSYRAFVEAN